MAMAKVLVHFRSRTTGAISDTVVVVPAETKDDAADSAMSMIDQGRFAIVRIQVVGWSEIVIDERLLDEFRSRGECEFCGLTCKRRDPHHIFARGMNGGGRLDVRSNLVGLCRPCHDKVHNGKINKSSLILIVSQREGLSPTVVMDGILWSQRSGREECEQIPEARQASPEVRLPEQEAAQP